MGNREITAKLGLDGKQAQSALRSFKDQVGSSFTEMNSALGVASAAWGALTTAIGLAVDVVESFVEIGKELADAASEQEEAEMRLATALRLRGQYSEDSFDSMKRFATEVSRGTTISDQAVIGLQSQLAALGVTKDQMELATKAAIGLSEITGKDLLSGARAVSQELRDGTSKEVKRLGLEGRNAHETMSNLSAAFQLAEEKAGTFSGSMAQLNNMWRDFEEQLGDAIIKSPDALRAIDELKRTLNEVGPVLVEIVVPAIKAVVSEIKDSLSSVREWAGAWKDLVGYAKQLHDKPFQMYAKPAGPEPDPNFVGPPRPLGIALGEKQPLIAPALTKAQEEQRKKALEEAKKYQAKLDEYDKQREKRENEANGNLFGGTAEFNKALEYQEQTHLKTLEDMRYAATLRHYDFVRANSEREREMKKEADEESFQQELKLYDGRKEAEKEFYAISLGALSNSIATVTEALFEGDKSAGDIAKSLTGGVISAIGNMLVQLGSAAVIAGGLGTVIPILAPLTGGPGGIALGLAAIVAGSAMVGAGNALAHSGGGKGVSTPGARAFGGGGFSGGGTQPEARGFSQFGASRGPVTNVTNVSVRGLVVGSERGLAREIGKIMRSGDSLTVGAH